MKIIVVVLLLIWLAKSQNESGQGINRSSIYGVRWFLAQKFRFQQPITIVKKQSGQSHLMMYFNTYSKWPAHNFAVQIKSNVYKCSMTQVQLNITADHHKNFNQFASEMGKSYTYFIYKCTILFQDQTFLCRTSHFAYQIFAHFQQERTLLFTSVLRSPSYNQEQMQMTTFGDWGPLTNYSKQSKLSVPITECLYNQIVGNQNIRLMLLLGDIGYDMQGLSYSIFFNYLQPFSRQLVIVLTPGNHQSIKHKDLFGLVKESFYSPFWSNFYGYFDFIQLGKYVMIGFSAQALFPALARDSNSSLFQNYLEEQYKSHYNLFSMQLPQQTKRKLKQQYSVIGFSHYPIYCSEQDEHQSCNNYLQQHLPYLEQLQSAGMNLYLSGHLHVYERSKQICQKGTLIKGPNSAEQVHSYEAKDGCTIFIVEGVSGNNYFVSTSSHFQLKNHTQKTVHNTGFGLLALDSKNKKIHFKHILAKQCNVADQIFLHYSTQQPIPATSTSRRYAKLVIGLIIIVLIVLLVTRWRRKLSQQQRERVETKRSQTNVIQLIEAE